VVLLTDRHIAYLYARRAQQSEGEVVTYKVKWFIPNAVVDNIRSIENTCRITIDYRKPISFGRSLQFRLPLKKGMRCGNDEAHRSLIFRLNLHLTRRKELARKADAAGEFGGEHGYDDDDEGELPAGVDGAGGLSIMPAAPSLGH
ncbi:hypothetical protein FOA52_002723, partial [Chlamydomonas sp. UWO 241]